MLRVATWNFDGLRLPEVLPELLAGLGADVVLIQGLRATRRQLRSDVRQAGLRIIAGGTRRTAGLAIAARSTLKSEEVPWIELPAGETAAGEPEPRTGIVGAAVTGRLGTEQLPTSGLLLVSTELGPSTGSRLRHTTWLLDYLRQANTMAIVGGGFHDRPAGTARMHLGTQLDDLAEQRRLPGTFPADSPDQGVDGLFVSPGFLVEEAAVVSDVAGVSLASVTNHLPTVVELHCRALAAPRQFGMSWNRE